MNRPIRRRALLVVALQRLPVIGPFVAERGAKRFEFAAVAHQTVPIIMPDLMAEMADQRAIGFAHRRAARLPLAIVGFCYV